MSTSTLEGIVCFVEPTHGLRQELQVAFAIVGKRYLFPDLCNKLAYNVCLSEVRFKKIQKFSGDRKGKKNHFG